MWNHRVPAHTVFVDRLDQMTPLAFGEMHRGQPVRTESVDSVVWVSMNDTHHTSTTIPFVPGRIGADAQQRGIGALIGSVVGDALGAPFEFGPPNAYSERFPTSCRGTSTEMVGGGAFDWDPGEFTDDSQMMLALAESLVARRGLDLDDLWERFRAWRSGATDCGTTTSAALSHDDRHEAAAEAHRHRGRTASNGALMRTWAVALAFVGHDTAEVMRVARAQAETTHFDPLAGWAASGHRRVRSDRPDRRRSHVRRPVVSRRVRSGAGGRLGAESGRGSLQRRRHHLSGTGGVGAAGVTRLRVGDARGHRSRW